MSMMNKQSIIDFFENNDITSNNDDDIIVKLEVEERLLDDLDFNYRKTIDGFVIEKKQKNNVYFFDSFDSCIGNLKHKKNNKIKNIFIVKEKQFYDAQKVLDCLVSRDKLIDLIRSQKIVDYDDVANKNLVFLSDTLGRVDVGYSHVMFSDVYFQCNISVIDYIEKIDAELNHVETQSIFRDCIVKLFTQNPKIDKNISSLIYHIKYLYEDFTRNINLYKNRYTFDTFITEFDKKKEEYIKHYNDFFSSIINKLYTIPIQIGGYVFLLSRTSDEELWAIISLLVVIFVGFFSNFIYTIAIDNTIFFKDDFDKKTEKIKNTLNLGDEDKFNEEVKSIGSRVSKILSALNTLKSVNIVISSVFSLICLYKIIMLILICK